MPCQGAYLARFGAIFALAAIMMGLGSCKSKLETGTPLAKVGESTLTLEEVRRIFPAEYEQVLPRDQYLEFVKRWVDEEVIYQQALKSGLEKDSSVERKVEEMRRKLLIEEFLKRENAESTVEPDAMALSQYYEMHREDFRRKAAEYRYLALRVKTLKEAIDLKPRLRNDDFLQIAGPHILDPLPENVESIHYRKGEEASPCLQPALANSAAGQVTGPFNCPEGIILLKVLARNEAGSMIPFKDAKDHIAGTMLMERKDKLREGIIAKYKDGVLISFSLEKIPGRETISEDNTPNTEPTTGTNPNDDRSVNSQDVGQKAVEPGAVAKSRKSIARPIARPAPPTGAEPTEVDSGSGSSNSQPSSPSSNSNGPKPESSLGSPQDMNGNNEAP